MYKVTAFYKGQNVGMAEGTDYSAAMDTAAAMAEALPWVCMDEVTLHAEKAGECFTVDTPLELWRMVSPAEVEPVARYTAELEEIPEPAPVPVPVPVQITHSWRPCRALAVLVLAVPVACLALYLWS